MQHISNLHALHHSRRQRSPACATSPSAMCQMSREPSCRDSNGVAASLLGGNRKPKDAAGHRSTRLQHARRETSSTLAPAARTKLHLAHALARQRSQRPAPRDCGDMALRTLKAVNQLQRAAETPRLPLPGRAKVHRCCTTAHVIKHSASGRVIYGLCARSNRSAACIHYSGCQGCLHSNARHHQRYDMSVLVVRAAWMASSLVSVRTRAAASHVAITRSIYGALVRRLTSLLAVRS